LVVLAVLLYTPGNLDKTGLLTGIFVQLLNDTLPIIVEDEIVGNERFDDGSTGRISMIVNLILSGLGIFTQAWPNVAAESHNIEKKITD
jgi:hypothetical protein